jgi:hypothetical protein
MRYAAALLGVFSAITATFAAPALVASPVSILATSPKPSPGPIAQQMAEALPEPEPQSFSARGMINLLVRIKNILKQPSNTWGVLIEHPGTLGTGESR